MRLPPAITSKTNAKVKMLRNSLSGKARRPGDLLGLEGLKLLQEAHMAGMTFETVFVREGSQELLGEAWSRDLHAESWVLLSREVFDSAVSTAAPQGVAATWVVRQIEEAWAQDHSVLVLENLQDPGNVGTLIRSAMAFGLGRVMVTPETVNEWNPKVVRAAAGAMFHVRVERLTLDRIMQQLRETRIRSFAAVSSFSSKPEGGVPSLMAKHGTLTSRTGNEVVDREYLSPEFSEELSAMRQSRYSALFSYDSDFLEPCALLIGNEGAGLSHAARTRADEQVFIPCGAESLNAAVAGSVLMYEVMRQRLLRIRALKREVRQ